MGGQGVKLWSTYILIMLAILFEEVIKFSCVLQAFECCSVFHLWDHTCIPNTNWHLTFHVYILGSDCLCISNVQYGLCVLIRSLLSSCVVVLYSPPLP